MKIPKKKIPIHTALWANTYNELIKHGVVFPKSWKGIYAAYAGLVAIAETLEEYKIKS